MGVDHNCRLRYIGLAAGLAMCADHVCSGDRPYQSLHMIPIGQCWQMTLSFAALVWGDATDETTLTGCRPSLPNTASRFEQV
ncbi:hypothetical protein J1614_000477 [Plenodomus biglobosus]|nr:hypothetical protein J1614_000477 [Plenodomus biglobosus]